MLTTSSTKPAAPVGGLCYPAGPGEEIDALMAASIRARRERMISVFARSPLADRLNDRLLSFIAQIKAMPAVDALRLFDTAQSGHLFGWRPARIVDDVAYAPSEIDYANWLLTTAAEAQVQTAPVLVSPALGRWAGNGLYFAERGLFMRGGDGPVAVLTKDGGLRVVRADGMAFTLPGVNAAPQPGIYADGAVQIFARAVGLPLLNGHPLFASLNLPVADPAAAEAGAPVIAEALTLLTAVWPAAKAFAERWMRAIVVLKYDGCSRSHTSAHAPQTLMCSTESPVKVAEAICHEFSHARMNLYMERGDIIVDDAAKTHPSPWRRDRRPIIGLINGVHAFLNVCEFYRRLAAFDTRRAQEAEGVIKTQSAKIAEAWRYAMEHVCWTREGERVAADLDAAVTRLCR